VHILVKLLLRVKVRKGKQVIPMNQKDLFIGARERRLSVKVQAFFYKSVFFQLLHRPLHTKALGNHRTLAVGTSGRTRPFASGAKKTVLAFT
jgi:hypothetical protein